jgi:site-specific recombinase XerD
MDMKQIIKLTIRKDQLTAVGKARIEFVLYFKGKQYRVSSGKNIEPRYWNAELGCVDKKSPEALEINMQLTEKTVNIDKYIRTKEVLNEKVSLTDLKSILKGQSAGKKITVQKKKCPSISEAFDAYVANTELKHSTVSNYDMTKKIVNDFCRKNYSKGMTINDIDFNFLEKFKKYLRTERERANNKNTIAKRLKILKSVYLYADNQGYIEKNAFKGYKIEHGKPKEVALSVEEYDKLRKVVLPKDACQSIKITRHVFVFCCETGLRYSDVMDLRWDNININMKSLSKIQVKTERNVYVPLSNQAKAILIVYGKKYKNSDGYVFPRIENQVMNRCLKEIAQIAEIYKNLTTHVARHTFGTRLGATGVVSAFTLCELMGHSDIGMTQRYINLSESDLNKTMMQVWEQKKIVSP